jgi:hypothetical protein
MARSAGKVRAAGLMAAGLMAVLGWGAAAAVAGQSASGQAGPGQAATSQNAKATPDGKKGEERLGSYALVTTVFEPSATTHLLMPRPTIDVEGGTEHAPGEFSGDKPVPAQYAIEGFGSPWYECAVAAAPAAATPAATVLKLRGCDALDRATLAVRDANTIGYHIVSHGAAVEVSVNVEVRDILPVSTGTAETEWHARDVIFVAVPKATPVYRFSSEVLVGTWNGEAIVFEVGKDLPTGAKKALEDLGVKQDLGDRVLYSFRVKAPGKTP